MVVAWLILQVADVTFDEIGVPDWTFRVVMVFLLIGFPIAVLLAWAYDLTPGGLKRTSDVDAETETLAGEDQVSAPFEPVPASVAVLPFVNMSGNPDNEYFSDGLSEELLNVLAKVNSLKVAARTSSFHFKGHTGDIETVARKLGVAAVLEGSVRQSGKRIRITAQLINAKDGYHLWSETFDRELDDIFEVQDEISGAVVKALKVKLLGEDTSSGNIGGTTDPEAFNAYLQGMHYRNRGSNKEALLQAVEHYRKAIEIDPDYALAYAGLASSLEHLATNSFAEFDQAVGQAEEAARRSIELAPALANGHLVLSTIAIGYRLDRATAMKEIGTAIALEPGNVAVLIEHARIHALCNDMETSLTTARTAQELDPVSTAAGQLLGHALYFSRHYNEAIDAFRHALSLDPHYPRPQYGIGMCQFQLGNFEAAAKSDGRYAEFESKFKIVGDRVIAVEQLALVTEDESETFRELTASRLAGLESVVDELNRAYMGFNQRPPPSPHPEHAPISPAHFVIGSPAGLQPNQTGGTLPSAAPPAGVFHQEGAVLGHKGMTADGRVHQIPAHP